MTLLYYSEKMRNALFRLGIKAGLAVFVLLPGMLTSQARELAPHKAIYEMQMLTAETETQLSDITGQNQFSLERDCDGYVTSENYLLEFRYGSGENAVVISEFESWEQTDSTLYSFSIREGSNFEADKKFEGYAQRPPQVAEPEAFFSMQPNSAIPLPPTVYFPIAHTKELLDKAAKGEKLFSADLFFGAEPDRAVRNTNSVIGKAQTSTNNIDMGTLSERVYYPVRIAYFDPKSSEPVPEFELKFHMQLNGVIPYYEIDYGDFSVDAKLTEIEALPQPYCS